MRDWDDDDDAKKRRKRNVGGNDTSDWDDDDDATERRERDENEQLRHWRPSASAKQVIGDEGKDVAEMPIIDGFEQSGVLSNEDVANHLAELPKEHTNPEHVESIKYTDEYKPDPKDSNYYIAGECVTDNNGVSRIDIHRQSPDGSYDADEMKRTITHEIAHSVYERLSDEQKEAWRDLYKDSDKNEFVSDYAKTDEEEDFAESYAAYVHDPDLLRSISRQKYSFMASRVFS